MPINKLIRGYHRFRDGPFEKNRQHFADLVAKGVLKLHGWYMDIATGELAAHNAKTGKFEGV